MSDKISFKGLCPPVNVCLLCAWYTYVCIHISSMCTIYMYVVLCISYLFFCLVCSVCMFALCMLHVHCVYMFSKSQLTVIGHASQNYMFWEYCFIFKVYYFRY